MEHFEIAPKAIAYLLQEDKGGFRETIEFLTAFISASDKCSDAVTIVEAKSLVKFVQNRITIASVAQKCLFYRLLVALTETELDFYLSRELFEILLKDSASVVDGSRAPINGEIEELAIYALLLLRNFNRISVDDSRLNEGFQVMLKIIKYFSNLS